MDGNREENDEKKYYNVRILKKKKSKTLDFNKTLGFVRTNPLIFIWECFCKLHLKVHLTTF